MTKSNYPMECCGSLHSDAGSQQAIQQDREHDQSEYNIHSIMFHGESYDGECHASDGRRDQQEQSQLDPSPAPVIDHTLHNSRDRAELRRLATKNAVVGGFVRVTREINAGSQDNDRSRDQHSGAQQIAQDDFDTVIVPRLCLWLDRLRRGRLSGVHWN